MQILLLSDRIPPGASGAGNAAWYLAEGLQGLGNQVHVVAASPATATNQIDGIETYYIPSNGSERWRAYRSLFNPPAVRAFITHLDKIKPDIVNAHNIHANLSYGCILAASLMGYPVVFTAHDVMSFSYGKLTHYVDALQCPEHTSKTYRLDPLHNLRIARLRYNPLRNIVIHHMLYKHVKSRVAVSRVLKIALEANSLPPFSVVPTGITERRMQPDQARMDKLRLRLGLQDKSIILMAGRIGEAKGSQQALAALSSVIERIPEAVLLILSDRAFDRGSYEDSLRDYIIEPGWLSGSELAAAYGLADIVICPSICLDSFSLVALEAMSVGKPVVASCHGGFHEAVLDGETGYIINPFDRNEFADRICALLSRPSLAKHMGESGYRRFLSEFTSERYAQRMLELYAALR